MSWLSFRIIQLDASLETDRMETELARREAELQERVSSALYRMDLKMLPLVAQEAVRPYYLYQPFYDVVQPKGPSGLPHQLHETSNAGLHLPSPLLFQPSEFVVLHFQIGADNKFTSPQYPENEERIEALETLNISPAVLGENLKKMEQAQRLFDYESLLQQCASIEVSQFAASADPTLAQNPPLVAYNVPAVEKFRNQIMVQQERLPADIASNTIDMQRSRGLQRVNQEFNQRRDSTQEFTRQNYTSNSFGYGNGIGFGNGGQMAIDNAAPQMKLAARRFDSLEAIESGSMRPMWIGDHLVLTRRVDDGQSPVIQCCWLNWERIKTTLQAEVAELLPDVQFESLTADTELKIGTALTTIPVQLIVDRPKMLATLAIDSQPIKKTLLGLPISLLAAWCGLGLAALASAMALHGVLRLSERRAAFVSAVTHELRTPLTTFRMYSEMLASGMVPSAKQQQYANALKVQADRLSHLVENVLQFARLERGAANVISETTTVGEMVDRFLVRLEERAADSQMQLEIEFKGLVASRLIETQPAIIERILFNLVDNACKYAQPASDRRIVIAIDLLENQVQFCVRDFGPGIAPTDRKRMFQPFHQSATAAADAVSGVGLGLALCRRMAFSLGGRLSYQDSVEGATFVLELPVK